MTEEREVGVAVSGGGHRATVFGLGALLALVDAGLNRRVTSISSVSGGSIANGVAMTGPDFGTATTEEFEAAIGPALRNIAARGVLLKKAPATAGYLRALVVAAALGALGVVAAIAFAVARIWIDAVAALAIGVIGLVAAWRLLRQRSARVERALDRELLGDRHVTLAQLRARPTDVHHVICTTELQTGEPFYFTNRAVYGYRFGMNLGDVDLPLATAVQASACVPGAFNPRSIALSRLGVHAPLNRDGSRNTAVSSIVVNDGGVYDNMADQWEYRFRGRVKDVPELVNAQRDRARFLVVVNGSGGWNDPLPLGRGGVAQELGGLLRSQAVQYDVSTSHRRQALFDRFRQSDAGGKDATDGVFVQITDSPYRIPQKFATATSGARDEAAVRADEAIAFLDECGYSPQWWDDVAARTSGVATTLARLGADTTAELLEHGYVLTMVNLYVLEGRGGLRRVDRERFARLCR
jgi:predicted acylesterase/phospholipase RssA